MPGSEVMRRAIPTGVALVLALSGCVSAAAASPPGRPITVAIAGDSISDFTDVPVATWPLYLDPSLVVADPADGFAVGGARIDQIRDGVTATNADVLVLMGGTNDLGHGVVRELVPVVVELVEKADTPEVLILAVPPLRDEATAIFVDQWNSRMSYTAGRHEWDYFDPWAQFRTDRGTWVEGSSFDGIHPTAETSEAIAALIQKHIVAMFKR